MTEQSRSEITRGRILARGRDLVLAGGFGGIGLSRILAESEVPKGSFYHYFPSKEAFGCAMLEDYVAGYLARFDALAEGPAPAGETLAAYWRSWLDDARTEGLASRCLVVKLAAEVADLSEPMRRILDDGVGQLIGRIAGLLRRGAADGSIRPVPDPARTARALYAEWLGAAILAKLARDEAPLRRAFEDTLARMAPEAPRG